ncbi:MAG: hypothetical protein ABGW82_12495, partial [Paracoccus sp. (in: a-proteobacteria)]
MMRRMGAPSLPFGDCSSDKQSQWTVSSKQARDHRVATPPKTGLKVGLLSPGGLEFPFAAKTLAHDARR